MAASRTDRLPTPIHNLTHVIPFLQTTPIHRLPPELLTRVFTYLRRIWINHHAPYSRQRTLLWTIVMEVCRRWRDVVLEAAVLWSYIPRFYHMPMIKRCLQLSKHAPLVVHLNTSATGDEVYQLFEGTAPRFRCLQVYTCDVGNSWQELCSLLSGPAPLLESLCIELSMRNEENTHSWMDNLCAGITPRLRNVSLLGCGINFSAPFLRNLTILE
ncbi:hypothetical protein BDN72DRAFT_781424, partial [Pluteus cervinus]